MTKKLSFEEAVRQVRDTEQHQEFYAEQVELYNRGAISYGHMADNIERYKTAILKEEAKGTE